MVFFRRVLIISIFLGIVIYFSGFLSVNLCPSLYDSTVSFLFVSVSLLCFIVAIVTGMVIKIISLHSKTVVSRFDAIAVLVFLIILGGSTDHNFSSACFSPCIYAACYHA